MWAEGGWRTERAGGEEVGGEVGGVTVCEEGGGVPAGQYGICLLGIGVVARGILSVKAGPRGGVEEGGTAFW